MLEIKGLEKTSLIDYPGKICSILFLPGCDFRCPFCHNGDLVLNPDKIPTISEKEVLESLKSRKAWIDGVTITGGEPTLYKELPVFIEKIKELGLLVKLDTNGSNPKMVKELINKKLLDFISMDIKNSKERYNETAGVKVDIENIEESIALIMNSGVDYEFRTTVLPRHHTKEDIVKISEWLKGAKKYVLQNFRNIGTLDKSYENENSFTKEELEEFRNLLKHCFQTIEIRV